MRMLLLAAFIAATPVQAADRDPQPALESSTHLAKCVDASSPLAIAYQSPTHWMRQRIEVTLPEPPAPPIEPAEIHLQDVDPDITDIPLTYPDPLTTVLKQQLEPK